jgi:hypothetical protein
MSVLPTCESVHFITHLISSPCYFSIDGPLNILPYFTGVISRYTEHAHVILRTSTCQSFSLGQPHFFSRSGRAYSAHSTAETVNSDVFQDAYEVKQLMERKKANDNASKTKVSVYSFS